MIKKIQSDLIQRKNNKLALGYMLGAVVLYSIAPLVFSAGNSNSAPFLFAALINFSAVISGLVFLVWFHKTRRKKRAIRETLGIIYSKFYSKAFLWVAIARFQHIFFAMSLTYINVAVASVLTAAKPLIVVVFISLALKGIERYKELTIEKWVLLALAFIGAGFVVASQSENFGEIVVDLLNHGAIVGISLAVLSALIGSMGTPYSLKLGVDASKKTGGGVTDELFFTIAFMFVVWVVGSVLFFSVGVAKEESFAGINIYPAIAFGILGQLIGVILSRLAYIKTTNLGISAIRYLTPIVGLIWLWIASLIDVPHFDWLAIGVTAIVGSNLLLNFKAGIRRAYKVGVVGG